MRPSWITLLWLGALGGAVALLGANLFLGNLNQDEGWYLYAARLVAEGQWPYRDFAFTQTPLLPLLYAWIQPAIEAWGLGAGRAFTALLGLTAALCAAALAARLAPPGRSTAAALISFVLIMVNVYQSYYFTIVKTYSLTAFCLAAGFLMLDLSVRRRSGWLAGGAGILLVLAAATRTSAGIIMPLTVIILWWQRRQTGGAVWQGLALGGLLAASLALLPFWIMAPEACRFFVIDYHTARASGSLLHSLIYKAGFLSRLVHGYFPAIAVWLAALSARWLLRARVENNASAPPPCPVRSTMLRLIWIGVGAISLVHFCAPFPYEDYQVFVYPLFAAAVAVLAVRLVTTAALPWLATMLLAISLAAAFSSPINQEWFVLGRDRIWWRLKEQTALQQLQNTAQLLRAQSAPGALLLTQDPYLAVESGLTLPRGLELGQFSYFPGLSTAQAQRLHVLNHEQFLDLLRTCPATIAAFSDYAFAMRSPEITPLAHAEQAAFWRLLEERYTQRQEIPNFGQAFTTLRIFTLNPAKEP